MERDAQIRLQTPRPETSVKDMAVLIVDGDSYSRHFLTTVLGNAGFGAVECAASGSEALQVLGPEPDPDANAMEVLRARDAADLVLLASELPDVDGLQLCRTIRDRFSPFVPIIMVTTQISKDSEIAAIQSGADDFIAKPIISPELLAKVELHLQRKRKYDEARIENAPTSVMPAANPDSLPAIGHQLSHYTIVKMLGWSGSSVLFKALENRTNVPYALKLLSPQAAANSDLCKRFTREMDVMLRLRHPHITQYHDRGNHGDCPYCVMEFVHGQNLEVLQAACGPQVDMDIVTAVAVAVASALQYIHDNQIVHRDVKLRNIIMGTRGVVKLADFGIALAAGDTRLTQTGKAVGTPLYMAPEQFGNSEITAAADIYSFGATIFHLLAGRPVFRGNNVAELMAQHLHETPPDLAPIRPDAPAGWNEVLHHCLAKTPADRPANMAEVLGRIRRLAAASVRAPESGTENA